MADISASHGAGCPESSRRRVSVFGRVINMFGTYHERRSLARLDDHLRKDLGLNERDIRLELDRPFWDAPDRWRR